MKIEETPLKDAYVLTPRVFNDERGYFFESFNEVTTKHSVLDNYNGFKKMNLSQQKGFYVASIFKKENMLRLN